MSKTQTPDPDTALLAYARAKSRIDRLGQPLRGESFERQTQRWRRSLVALDRAAAAYRVERVRAYLDRRRLRTAELEDQA